MFCHLIAHFIPPNYKQIGISTRIIGESGRAYVDIGKIYDSHIARGVITNALLEPN